MAVEIFDEEAEPSTSLHIAIYNVKGSLVPSWWMEIPDEGWYDVAEMETILDCLPSIQIAIEKMVEHLK